MTTERYTLPPGSRILVTGANGYIASHVVNELLSLGYVVRGTVRSPKPWLNEYFEQRYGRNVFETAIMTSFEDRDAIGHVLDGVDGVAHLVRMGRVSDMLLCSNEQQASDLTFGTDPKAVIPWVVQASLNILEAAAKRPSIKRVVLASSSSATYMLSPDPNGRQIHKGKIGHDLANFG